VAGAARVAGAAGVAEPTCFQVFLYRFGLGVWFPPEVCAGRLWPVCILSLIPSVV